MPKRSGKRPADLNSLAASIVGDSTDDAPAEDSPLARAGQQGGVKGGPARAAKLSAEERSQIAQKAARARWGSQPR
jgi:hypothetical protein